METERCILRPFEETDAPRVYDLAKVDDVGVHAGWPPHKSCEETRYILKNILMVEGTFAIVDKASNAIIGCCGLAKDPYRNNPFSRMLGYWIGKEYWGRGIIKEVSHCLMKYGFKEYNLTLISVNCYSYNIQSERVIEKLGFVYEGTLRQGVLRFDGELLHLKQYSITKEEFAKILL